MEAGSELNIEKTDYFICLYVKSSIKPLKNTPDVRSFAMPVFTNIFWAIYTLSV